VDSAASAVYRRLADQLTRTGEARAIQDTALAAVDLAGHSLLLLGTADENGVTRILPLPQGLRLRRGDIEVAGESLTEPGASLFLCLRSPFDRSRQVCVVCGNTAEAVEASGPKIVHYGKYSFVTFLDGRRLRAGVLPVERNPMVRTFGGETR
jgi:hypothetical protein